MCECLFFGLNKYYKFHNSLHSTYTPSSTSHLCWVSRGSFAHNICPQALGPIFWHLPVWWWVFVYPWSINWVSHQVVYAYMPIGSYNFKNSNTPCTHHFLKVNTHPHLIAGVSKISNIHNQTLLGNNINVRCPSKIQINNCFILELCYFQIERKKISLGFTNELYYLQEKKKLFRFSKLLEIISMHFELWLPLVTFR
jgi:hypothetical protein